MRVRVVPSLEPEIVVFNLSGRSTLTCSFREPRAALVPAGAAGLLGRGYTDPFAGL